jgi:serine/threonine-protein kinase RsbT
MADLESELRRVLTECVGELLARTVLQTSLRTTDVDLGLITLRDADALREQLELALKLYVKDDAKRRNAALAIATLLRRAVGRPSNPVQLALKRSVEISEEAHIVVARGVGRDLCAGAGCPVSTQIKIATVVSELARNIIQYAGRGVIDVEIADTTPPSVLIHAVDHGPGIADVEGVLGGQYRSKTGMGMGLLGAKRLMDEFQISTSPGLGTAITARKFLR